MKIWLRSKSGENWPSSSYDAREVINLEPHRIRLDGYALSWGMATIREKLGHLTELVLSPGILASRENDIVRRGQAKGEFSSESCLKSESWTSRIRPFP